MYTPDFSDPRVIARLKKAYGFCKAFLSPSNSTPVAKVMLDRAFGQQQHDLTKWLRSTLLICTDEVYSFGLHGPSKDGFMGKVKEYTYSSEGARLVKSIIKGELDKNGSIAGKLIVSQVSGHTEEHDFDALVVSEWAHREYPELKTLDFIYQDKSNRWWHPLQNVKTEYRTQLFAESGLNWNYDINACAPTLILQYAQQLGMDEYLFAINKYLTDKDEIRQHVANVAEIPLSQAKVLINALFNSAVLGATKHRSQFGVLCKHKIDEINENNPDEKVNWKTYRPTKDDVRRMKALQRDKFVTELREDIKKCWTAISTNMSRVKAPDKNGRLRLRPVSSTQKWNVYYMLERKVMYEVREYLIRTGNLYFLEHDGWRCKSQVDLQQLRNVVMEKTGYNVTFKEENTNEKV